MNSLPPQGMYACDVAVIDDPDLKRILDTSAKSFLTLFLSIRPEYKYEIISAELNLIRYRAFKDTDKGLALALTFITKRGKYYGVTPACLTLEQAAEQIQLRHIQVHMLSQILTGMKKEYNLN